MKAPQLLCVWFLLSITSTIFGERTRVKGLHRILCPSPCDRCEENLLKGCKSCKANAHLYRQWGTHGICVGNCPMGYYSHHHVCTECGLYKCISCVDGRTCRRCVYPYRLHDGQCFTKCPKGTDETNYKGFGVVCHPGSGDESEETDDNDINPLTLEELANMLEAHVHAQAQAQAQAQNGTQVENEAKVENEVQVENEAQTNGKIKPTDKTIEE